MSNFFPDYPLPAVPESPEPSASQVKPEELEEDWEDPGVIPIADLVADPDTVFLVPHAHLTVGGIEAPHGSHSPPDMKPVTVDLTDDGQIRICDRDST